MTASRTYLTDALTQAILKRDGENANKFIDLFDDINLNHLDADGKSFIFLAIANKVRSTAEKLFTVQKDQPEIIFRKNNKGETLFWCAAQSGYSEMLECLIKEAKKKQTNEVGYQFWLLTDNEENTPLHVARGKNTVNLLLQTVAAHMQENERLKCVNQPNQVGDTFLHNIVRAGRNDLIPIIFATGADWLVVNNNRESAFTVFCDHTIGMQISILTALASYHDFKTQKNYAHLFLQIYKEQLQKNHTKVSLQNYYILSGALGLKELAMAHMEMDVRIELRNDYTQTIRNAGDDRLHAEGKIVTCRVESKKKSIPKEIFALIPAYHSKVKQAEKEWDKQHPSILLEEYKHADSLQKVAPPHYQQVSENRAMLAELMKDINSYVTDLEKNPRYSQAKKNLTILINVLAWLIYGGLEAWFVYHEIVIAPSKCSSDDPEYVRCVNSYQINARIFSVLFGGGGGIATLGLGFLTHSKLWTKESNISQNEWLQMINRLRADVLDKLKSLRAEESPTDAQTIQTLEHNINAVQDDQSRHQVIDYFKQINQTLLKLGKDMNRSMRPFSIWKSVEDDFVIIENIPTRNLIEDEETPLLVSRNSSRKGCITII